MDTTDERKPAADLGDYLAEERTLLAWIRTSLALMGFGFVVARFGLFLQALQFTRGEPVAQGNGLSPWVGIAFIAVGVAVNLSSIRRHVRMVAELNRGQFTPRDLSLQAVFLALFLALGGISMVLYLTLA
jgi:inner membrane protein YidH